MAGKRGVFHCIDANARPFGHGLGRLGWRLVACSGQQAEAGNRGSDR